MVNFNHDIRFITTPEELRRLADKMEQTYKQLRPGDSKVIEEFKEGGNTLKVVADQGEMGDPWRYEGSG